jgi:tetratricopeptide (TPR) repeat protein
MASSGSPEEKKMHDNENVELYTKEGVKILVSKTEWKGALPEYFKEVSANPDETYKLIVLSLQDGLYEECLDPARMLVSSDPNKERAANILGIVLLKNGLLKEAQEVLEEYLKETGPSGAILTNLAKIYEQKGDERKAYKTLWKALIADPNQDNALAWWYSIHKENKETQRLDESLIKLTEIPGSFRPMAYLAVRSFEENETENAMLILRKVLESAGENPDALMIVSGELAFRGYVREALDMVYPIYDARKHGHLAGLNLILACVTLKEREKGVELCDAVESLGRSDLRQRIHGLREELLKMGS